MTIAEMEAELERLVATRAQAVGIDLKRTNHKIAALQNRIQIAEASV